MRQRVTKTVKTFIASDHGYILMLALIIMMTLTVIAVGFVTNVVLETSITKNYRSSRDTLNAAEAGLEVAMMITHEEIISQLEPFSGTTRTEYVDENMTRYGYQFQPLFDDFNGNEVKYRVVPENPDPQKNRFLYRTYESCQEIIHYAYPYVIEVVTKPIGSTGGSEYLKRQIRVLETPLVQYFVFFDDDLPWHPGPEMNAWGRVHTNGNLWFSPDSNSIYIKNLTRASERVQHFVTASGVIYQDSLLGPNPTWGRNGHIYVRVYHLSSTTDSKCVYTASTTGCDYIEINVDINSANAQTQQDRFTDANDCSYVMVGVPKSPAISFNALFREGFYERKARAPERSEYFGITIVLEGGGAGADWPPRVLTDHTGTLHIYAATKDFAYDSNAYTDGVKIEDVTEQVFNAGSDVLGVDGCIVYSPETVYNPLTAGIKFPANDTTSGYPVYLEKNDQRQDMHGVATTVIDVDKLEKWFYEYYLDFQYDNRADNQNITTFLVDGTTGNKTKLVIYVSRTPTQAEVPGWAGYTVNGGPPYPYYDTPGSQILQAIRLQAKELICPTTIASDNPVYVVGDFNVGSTYARTGCAVIGDLVNILSKEWPTDNLGRTGGRPNPNPNNTLSMNGADSLTIFNAAFFSGRDDLDRFAVRGGALNDETEGLHNFLEYHENWNNTCQINGCLINLWFTRQALGLFDCCGTTATDVYDPPTRDFGWDPGYMDSQYWPPYCPSAYGVEKVGWFEGTDYEDEYIWDPSEE